MLRRLLVLSALVLFLSGPAVASAQTTPYPGGVSGEVQSDDQQRGETEVRGVATERPAPVVSSSSAAPGGLAVTGTDVAQLSVLAVALIGGGFVLVRRSRRQVPATATS